MAAKMKSDIEIARAARMKPIADFPVRRGGHGNHAQIPRRCLACNALRKRIYDRTPEKEGDQDFFE